MWWVAKRLASSRKLDAIKNKFILRQPWRSDLCRLALGGHEFELVIDQSQSKLGILRLLTTALNLVSQALMNKRV